MHFSLDFHIFTTICIRYYIYKQINYTNVLQFNNQINHPSPQDPISIRYKDGQGEVQRMDPRSIVRGYNLPTINHIVKKIFTRYYIYKQINN